MRKLFLTNRPFLISLTLWIWPKNHGVLKVLTKIQFDHNHLNLTNIKTLRTTLTIWQVSTSIKLNLNMNVNLSFNLVIQFQFLNQCWLVYCYLIWTTFPSQFWFSCLYILNLNHQSCKITFYFWKMNVNQTFIFLIWANSWTNFDSKTCTRFESNLWISNGSWTVNSWAHQPSHQIVFNCWIKVCNNITRRYFSELDVRRG